MAYKKPSFFTLKKMRNRGNNEQNGGSQGNKIPNEKKKWISFSKKNATKSRFLNQKIKYKYKSWFYKTYN